MPYIPPTQVMNGFYGSIINFNYSTFQDRFKIIDSEDERDPEKGECARIILPFLGEYSFWKVNFFLNFVLGDLLKSVRHRVFYAADLNPAHFPPFNAKG